MVQPQGLLLDLAQQRRDAAFIPKDAVLLPTPAGALLVSRGHAVFCGIPRAQLDAVRDTIAGHAPLSALPPELVERMREHGFGGPPRQAKPASPSVQLQLTNACNLACAYCCTNSGAPRREELTREQAFEVVEATSRMLGRGTRLALLGGEPLRVAWALDLASRGLDHELDVTLFTNGMPLVHDAIAARVGEMHKRGMHVRVSLAGASRATCDKASGAARFDQVLAGVANLARFGPPPVIDLMLLAPQVDDVAYHLSELRRLLPPRTVLAIGIPYVSGREQGQHVFSSRAQLEDALDRIAFEAGETIPAVQPRPLADRRDGCSCALGHDLHVRSDGALFTCFKMEECVGHLRELTFQQALASLRAKARPAQTLRACADCALAPLCGGGCRSENLQLTGDADEPVCGAWRVRVLSELLEEDRVNALEWPAAHLLAEAHARGIEAPPMLQPVRLSRHLLET